MRLTKTQLILLSGAIEADQNSLFPVSDLLSSASDYRISKETRGLVHCGFAEERETHEEGFTWRADCDVWYGVFATDAGLEHIRAHTERAKANGEQKAQSKIAMVIALLHRESGATLAELVTTTGWQAHSTRAALTSLRKKGHILERFKRGEDSSYRIAKAG